MNINLPLSHRGKEPERGVLYIVGTPIGNLSDISSRATNILKNVSLIACEDTRQTKKIMNTFSIKNNTISFNKDNSFIKIPKIINLLLDGSSIALVSDAGMPGICDPGEELIKKIKSIGLEVICIPGPCAALTALVSSGLPSSKFIFEGFLPKKKIEREGILLEISQNYKTTIIFESPNRLLKTLNELKEYCGGSRKIEVCRELTKKFEEHVGYDIDSVIEFFCNKKILGEITIVIDGLKKTATQEVNILKIKKELHSLIEAGLSLSAASKYLAKKENLTKSMVYKLY